MGFTPDRMNRNPRKGSADPKAKSVQMKKGQNRVSKKLPYEASKEYLAALSAMLINPAECDEIVRSPADFAMVGDVKCFTRTFQLKASDLVDQSNFAMTISPSIVNFFSLSAAGPFAPGVPFRGASDGLSPNQIGGEFDLGGRIDLYPVINPVDVPTSTVSSQAYQGKTAFHVNAGAGEILEIGLSADQPALFTTWFHDQVTNAWLNMGTLMSEFGTFFVPFTVPGGVVLDAFSIQCGAQVGSVAANFRFTPGFTIPQDVHTQTLYSSDAVLLGRVERYRVTALSVLATYSGDFLNNGGVIASARTQPKYAFNDVPYDALTKLQDHKYQGPMVDGAYAWWLPYSYEEMDYRTDPLASASATQLRVAGQFANANGALQITVCAVVEFYSPLQIFSHEPGPFSSDEYLELLHALDRIPAATCNPGHREVFSALWDKGVSLARSGVGYLIEHPEMIAKIAALFLA